MFANQGVQPSGSSGRLTAYVPCVPAWRAHARDPRVRATAPAGGHVSASLGEEAWGVVSLSYSRGSRPTSAPSPLPGPVAPPLLASPLGAARTPLGFRWRVGEKVAKSLLVQTRRALIDVGHPRRHSGGVPASALHTTHVSRFEGTRCTQVLSSSTRCHQSQSTINLKHAIRGPQRLITPARHGSDGRHARCGHEAIQRLACQPSEAPRSPQAAHAPPSGGTAGATPPAHQGHHRWPYLDPL